MDHEIVIPSESYDFSKIKLSTPIDLKSGGTHFTKILQNGNNNELFIQTPKCHSKQGFVKNGRRTHIDLIFDKYDEQFIEWFETLETMLQKMIFERRAHWFESDQTIELDDIENAFCNTVKSYRSGNYHLIRAYADSPRLMHTSNSLTIYDQNENTMTMDEITPESSIISILQIHGIKFTPRSFQLYTQIKQVMVVKTNLFSQCRIKSVNTLPVMNTLSTEETEEPEEKTITASAVSVETEIDENQHINTSEVLEKDEDIEDILRNTDKHDGIELNITEKEDETMNSLEESPNETLKNASIEIDTGNNLDTTNTTDLPIDNVKLEEVNTETFSSNINDNDNDNDNLCPNKENLEEPPSIDLDIQLQEFDINPDGLETVTVRDVNSIYLEKYKSAKRDAKLARQKAIEATLELKNIRRSMPLDMVDTDSDDDESNDDLDDESSILSLNEISQTDDKMNLNLNAK